MKTSTSNNPLRVEIRWIDSGLARDGFEAGWESQDMIVRAVPLHEISTVGWLIHEDDFAYVVCTSYDLVDNTFFGTQAIAKADVTSISRLRARTAGEK